MYTRNITLQRTAPHHINGYLIQS